MKLTLNDSRGKPSTTLFFVVVGLVPVMLKFLVSIFAGMEIAYQTTVQGTPWHIVWTVPDMSGMDFAAAFGAIFGIWTLRENKEKGKSNNG